MFKKINEFIALDLETTGLDFENDEIIEVAMAKFKDGKIIETFDSLIKPKQELNEFVSRLTGINKEDLVDAPVFKMKKDEMLSFIGNLPIVAHNSMFDEHFFSGNLKRLGLTESLPVFIDTLLASRIAWWSNPNHRLGSLVEYLGIELSQAHRALPDAQACGELFVKAQEVFQSYPLNLQAQLGQLAQGTTWELLFNAPEQIDDMWKDYQYKEGNAPHQEKDSYSELPLNIEDFFAENGVIANEMENYSQLPSQLAMSKAVNNNLNKGGALLTEAGTGTGKSLAYLLPTAKFLNDNPGERIVISTGTKALQHQLLDQEIPLLEKLFGKNLKASVLKGRRNYICLRKFENHLAHSRMLLTPDERLSFMPLIPWIIQTHTGDAQENPGFNLGRNQILWNKLASDSLSCTGDCSDFRNECFFQSAKKRSAQSNLILINHALFLQDMALDFALVPAYNHIIFDEAHNLPDQSSYQQTRALWFFRLRNILQLFIHPRQKSMGIIKQIMFDLEDKGINENDEIMQLLLGIESSLARTEKALHKFLLSIGKDIKKNKKGGFSGQIIFKDSLALEFNCNADTFLNEIQDTINRLEKITEEKVLSKWHRDFKAGALALNEFINDLRFISKANNEDFVFWLEEATNPHTIKIKAAPVSAGIAWNENFYPWIKSATFVSATLDINENSEYFQEQMGLKIKDQPSKIRVINRTYKSPFDTKKQMRIMIADFLPKANEKNFQAKLDELLKYILPETKLGTLGLYTNISSLTQSQKALAPDFEKNNRQLLVQHVNGNFDGLLNIYKKEPASCLLGTNIFWEGVDLPGKLLELLVIPKLPFPMPNEPLLKAKSDKLQAEGRNPFKELHMPIAMTHLRQGMGRLLRSREDRGIVLILDKRLVSEGYGKVISSQLWHNNHEIYKDAESLKAALTEYTSK